MHNPIHKISNANADLRTGDCSHCGRNVNLAKTKNGWRCGIAKNIYQRKYMNSSKYKSAKYSAKCHAKRKLKVIDHYSQGKMNCARCGFSDIRALSIDHINGDGVKHRESYGNGPSFYRHLLKDKPDGLQVLCMNCQWIKRSEKEEYGISRS